MPDIQITDELGESVDSIKVDLAHPSSIVKYLKSQLLHLAVVPDFLARKDQPLTQAAPSPIEFQARAEHEFDLGSSGVPEISISPSAEATIRVNASPATDLFATDPFLVPTLVPAHTAYLALGLQGGLSFDVSGSEGHLTFGLDSHASIALDYWKAFPTGAGATEPTLGAALGAALSSFVIPATVDDLALLGSNDIATVSGEGSLKVSGAVAVSFTPNPLASVDLPFGAGTVAVKAGATAGLSASFTVSGAYQIRVHRTGVGTIELSYYRQHGTLLKAGLSASAGIKATVDGNDLITTLLDAVSTDPTADQSLLSGLTSSEAATLTAAIQSGLNRSLQASLELVLSSQRDQDAAFQYEIQPALLDEAGIAAVNKALTGDLRLLTALEGHQMQPIGVLAPGIRLLNSILTLTRKTGLSLKLNLIGIVNYVSISQLIQHSEILTDDATGDVTIKETVTGNRISAITDPLARQEALRKVMFDSVLVTTSYRAGNVIALPELDCQQVHFAVNQNTNHQIIADYLRWFVALHLLGPQDPPAMLQKFIDGGPSTCVLRTLFRDQDCASLFFDADGHARPKSDYLDIGRHALRALLDPQHQAIDQLRSQILDDSLWPTAVSTGANVNLGPLVGLSTADPRVQVLSGDVQVITSWAGAMASTGPLIADVRAYAASADPALLANDLQFKKKRDALQSQLSKIVKASKVRFEEPWGMVCLLWAAGSPHTSQATIASCSLSLARPTATTLAAAARSSVPHTPPALGD